MRAMRRHVSPSWNESLRILNGNSRRSSINKQTTESPETTRMVSNWYKDFRASAGVEVGGYKPDRSMAYTGPPMDLANMRENGVHSIRVFCLDCDHKADVNDASLARPGANATGFTAFEYGLS